MYIKFVEFKRKPTEKWERNRSPDCECLIFNQERYLEAENNSLISLQREKYSRPKKDRRFYIGNGGAPTWNKSVRIMEERGIREYKNFTGGGKSQRGWKVK